MIFAVIARPSSSNLIAHDSRFSDPRARRASPFLSLPFFVSPSREEVATSIKNRARGTFATTRSDRLAAPLIIHTRSRASDGGLLIQFTTQNPPGQPSFRHPPCFTLCSVPRCLFSRPAAAASRIYFFARGNYFWCLFPRFVNTHLLVFARSRFISLSLSLSFSSFSAPVLHSREIILFLSLSLSCFAAVLTLKP